MRHQQVDLILRLFPCDDCPNHNLVIELTRFLDIILGFDGCEWNSGVLSTLFRFAEQFSDASSCIEALQVLCVLTILVFPSKGFKVEFRSYNKNIFTDL